MNACAPAVWLLVVNTRITQYRARAVAVLSIEWVFGDTFGQDNKRQFPRLLFCVNLKDMPNEGRGGEEYTIMKEQCPKCGNWVEGRRVQSYTKKVAKTGVKSLVNGAASVGATGTGAAIGSAILPGIGTIIGGAAGFIASSMFHTAVNEGIDKVADGTEELLAELEYEFTCPKCGRYWKRKDSSTNISEPTRIPYETSSTSYSNNGERYAILELVKECASNKSLNEGCSVSFVGINASKLSNKLQKQYGIKVYDWQITSCKTIKELISLIENKIEFSPSTPTINTKQELFNNEFHYYLDNVDGIIETKEKVKNYVNKVGSLLSGCDITVKSEFHFLQAICCLDYSLLHEDDITLLSLGKSYIDKANGLLDDGEYKLVNLMFESLSVNQYAQDLVQVQQNFKWKCPKIKMLENTLFKNEYLEELYEKTRFYSLIDSASALENREDFKGAAKCLEMMTELSDMGYKICGYELLMDYYYFGRKGLGEYKELGFMFAQKGYELADFSNDFNPEVSYQARWLRCLERIAYAYLEGEGTTQDYKKAFEYTTKAANLGGMYSAYNLGEIYELGRGVAVDKVLALEWYEKALALGFDGAKERIKQLKSNSISIPKQTSNISLSEDEQEYLDEVKMCLEEDNEISPKERRLLDRLRVKLNISEERAKELEDSLNTPQLTKEEQEYLEEYNLCLEEDGEISPKERRLLDRLRDKLCISVERAEELEKIIV